MAIVNIIRLLGEDFSESRVVEKVITTLPDRFKSNISSLEDSRDLTTISLSELVNSFYALEQKRANRQEEHPEGAFQAKAKESSSLSQKGKKPCLYKRERPRRDAGKRRFPPYIHCKKTTHLEKYCWYRPDIQYRSCKQFGHVEKDEHVFTASCFATSRKVICNWLVDSGYTHHMAVDESNEDLIEAKGRGNAVINTGSGNKIILDVLFVPDIDQNLLSVGQLVEKGYSLVFKNGSCVIEDFHGQEIVTVGMVDKCFMLDVNQLEKKAYTSLADNADLWHRRLGHANFRSLDLLHKLNLVEEMSKVEVRDTVCEICQLGKQARLPFPVNQAWKVRERLELVHYDVCGLMKSLSLNDNKFKTLVKNQSGCKIKALRTDNGTEYLSKRFQKLYEQERTHHQLTTVYTPQQNGVCERKSKTVMDMARCLLFQSKLPSKFWAEAVNTSVYLLNKLLNRALKKRTKLERRFAPGIFVGYSSTKKGYRVFDPSTKKILVSRDIKFDEDKVWSWDSSNASLFEEDQFDISLEPAGSESGNANIDDPPVRGTRTIIDIYHRCNVAIVEPSSFEEAPGQKKVIDVKWVFRAKFNADGSLNMHKARLVVKGYNQQYGIDFMETCALVARLGTIKLLFALAAQKQWRIHQLDVKSAFLNGFLKEEIYIEQPEGFKVLGEEDKAPRAWYDKVDDYLSRLGFEKSLSEPMLYVKKTEDETLLIVSIYVDGLLVTGSKTDLINDFKTQMQEVFDMTDLGIMTYFLGMEMNQSDQGIFISQHAFALKILNKFCMTNCKAVRTPLTQGEKLTSFGAKRILRYVKGTLKLSVMFKKEKELRLAGYSDSDWAGSVDDMKSTSAKAEYITAAAVVNQAIWLRKLLFDLNEDQSEATEIMVNNQSAVAIAKNPVFHGKTKHFKIKFHFVREAEQSGEISLVHCNSENHPRSVEHWPAIQHVTSNSPSRPAME
ncbi:hypothetical protein CXB51_020668 [Gossypium anomalum]|uniref:Integrase catalytic domain-containing protein n=1 Tax=Gossypium anomalum TaxID=47600 RepID=A0A8J5YQW1_9ROSI|nr:hypothetical protein CXB51_020668 [Gossypium anomalum]